MAQITASVDLVNSPEWPAVLAEWSEWQKQLAELRTAQDTPAPPVKPVTRPPLWRSIDDC